MTTPTTTTDLRSSAREEAEAKMRLARMAEGQGEPRLARGYYRQAADRFAAAGLRGSAALACRDMARCDEW